MFKTKQHCFVCLLCARAKQLTQYLESKLNDNLVVVTQHGHLITLKYD